MKKSLLPLAAAAAMIGGVLSSPAGQQVVEQTSKLGQQIEQAAQNNRTACQGQQAAQRAVIMVPQRMMNPYIPANAVYRMSDMGMTPKAYGEWLAMSGKNKYNKRKARHIAKMRS